jgi:hypothetical protein
VVEIGVDAGRVLYDLTSSRPRPLPTEGQNWWPGDIARSYRHYSANSSFEYVRDRHLTLLSTTCARTALAWSLPCLSSEEPGTRFPHKPTEQRKLPFGACQHRENRVCRVSSIFVRVCISPSASKQHTGTGVSRVRLQGVGIFLRVRLVSTSLSPFLQVSLAFLKCICTTRCCMFRFRLRVQNVQHQYTTLGAISHLSLSPLVAPARLVCTLRTEPLDVDLMLSLGNAQLGRCSAWAMLMLMLK